MDKWDVDFKKVKGGYMGYAPNGDTQFLTEEEYKKFLFNRAKRAGSLNRWGDEFERKMFGD